MKRPLSILLLIVFLGLAFQGTEVLRPPDRPGVPGGSSTDRQLSGPRQPRRRCWFPCATGKPTLALVARPDPGFLHELSMDPNLLS